MTTRRTTAETVQPLRPDFDPAPLPEVVGGFKTVLADPPWRFTNRTGKVAPEHRRLDRYSTMTLAAIKDIEVAEVAAKNAHLYLWVPNALLPDGLAVMEAWGFRYVSNVVWAKRRKDGGPDGRGVGFYFRNVTEILLFGVRGSMRTMAPARRQVNMIETRKREHSRKPDEQYELIEACSPGPHLELFARHPRKGWSVWGDESLDDVAPRGKVHRGYAGGPIDTPDLDPYERLQPDTQAAVAAIHHHPRERTTRMTTPTNPPAGDMTAPSEGRRTRLGEVIYGAMFEVQIDLRYGGAEKAEYIADAVRRALEEAEPGDHPDYAAAHPLLRAVETAEAEGVTA